MELRRRCAIFLSNLTQVSHVLDLGNNAVDDLTRHTQPWPATPQHDKCNSRDGRRIYIFDCAENEAELQLA